MRGISFRLTWRNLKQNPWMNAITLATIALSFLILGVFLVIFLNTRALMEEWKAKIRVTAFITAAANPEGVARLKEKIRGMEEVEGVLYRSSQDALKILEERLKGGLLKGLPRNPLPASLEIRLKAAFRNSIGVQNLVSRLRGAPEIEEVQFGSEWVERFSAFMMLLEFLGLSLGGLLLLATLFVISNTIRLKIFARREEIEVVRSVGATGFFVRAPFYLEGVLQGFLGACLAVGVLFLLFELFLLKVYEPLSDLLGNFPLHFLSLEQMGGLLLGGIVLGFLGTQASVGRYLRA